MFLLPRRNSMRTGAPSIAIPARRARFPHPALSQRERGISAGGAEADGLKCACLPARDDFLVEVGDRVLARAMKVEPRPKAQKRAAEADRRALQKHEFARDRQAAALGPQRAHHLADLASAIFRRFDAV